MEEKPVELDVNWRNPDGTFKSGHPDFGAGRPTGTRDFNTIYKAALERLAKENNKTPEELEDEMLAMGIVQSRKGQFNFYKDTLDRKHGKAMERTDITSGGEKIMVLPATLIDKNDINRDTGDRSEGQTSL